MHKTIFLSVVAVLFTSAVLADSIEGKWIGTVGNDQDRVAIALDFKSKPDGSMYALVYQPVVNFYGLPVRVKREDGDKYVIADLESTLALTSGRLEGSMTSLNLPVSLKRTDKLPEDTKVPDLPKGPEPAWLAHLGGAIYAPVAVRDGTAYVGTTSGIFNAIKTKDGKQAWTFSTGKPIYGGALVTDDAVFFACDNGSLYRLDRKTGKEVWHYDLGDLSVSRVLPHPFVYDWDNKSPQPVLADGTIYIGSGDGSLHAVNAANGQRVWRFETKDKIRSDAVVAGTRVIVGSLDGAVYAVDRQTGQQLWRRATKGPVTSSPSIVDGKVIVGNRASLVSAIDPADGEFVWRASFWGSWVESAAVPYSNLFYIGASDLRRVTCYDPKDGRVVWRTDVYGWTWGLPAVTEKMIYVGVAGGSPYFIRHVPSLTALDRATGKIVWRWVPPESPAFQSGFPAGPAIEGKTLVIGALDGTVYGFPLS